MQQALIGNWAVAPWGSDITDKEERRHFLRIRGRGPVTSVILLWRRRARPGSLGISREGEGTIMRGEGVMVRIDANGYAYADGAGAVIRRCDGPPITARVTAPTRLIGVRLAVSRTRWSAPSRYDASSSRTLFAPAACRLKRATDTVPLDRVALD